jgi:hypothetical protein
VNSLKIIGICGQGGAGKDSLYEHVLKPRGFLRWQMTLHYKVWLASTGRYDWDDIFYNKPPEVRKVLQEEITALRDEWDEHIWANVLESWMRAMFEIVGVTCAGIAVTDLRFLVEMRQIKLMGGKILHIEAVDQQANIAPELRAHRSEVEMHSPEVKELRDAHIFNQKEGIDKLKRQGLDVLQAWDWL